MNLLPNWLRPAWFMGRSKITSRSLQRWNIVLAVLFILQGSAILLFSSAYAVPINLQFLTADSIQTQLSHAPVMAPAIHQLILVGISYLVAGWFLFAAFIHLLEATVYRLKYEAVIAKRKNGFRWFEYVVSSGMMALLVGLLCGIYDFVSLLFMVFIAMLVAGWGMVFEQQPGAFVKRPEASRWLLSIGLASSIVIALGVGLSILATDIFGTSQVSVYVYTIVVSGILFFAAFACNIYLIRLKKGRWANYTYGEAWYMGLSFMIKTVLAWQVFAAVLRS